MDRELIESPGTPEWSSIRVDKANLSDPRGEGEQGVESRESRVRSQISVEHWEEGILDIPEEMKRDRAQEVAGRGNRMFGKFEDLREVR